MSSSPPISIRLPDGLLERIKAVCDNRNSFIVSAIEEKLSPVKVKDDVLSEGEKAKLVTRAKRMDTLLDDALMQVMSKRTDFLENLDAEQLARLVASRLPKADVGDAEVAKDVLSLSDCLGGLPSVSDITGELNRVKGALHKAEAERDLNGLLLTRLKGGNVDLFEMLERMYRMAVEYVVELVSRASLPGLESGGGLGEAALREIGERVRGDLEKFRLFKKGQ